MPEIKCPTKEQILSAANEDCVVRKALEKLFPEAFVPEPVCTDKLRGGMQPRTSGKYKDKGMYLSSSLDWKIVSDDGGYSILIATAKPR